MRRIVLVLFVSVLVLALFGPGQTQSLKLAKGQLLYADGAPAANRAILVEGSSDDYWYRPSWLFSGDTVKLVGFTDDGGYIEIVDLPPGSYTMKLVVSGTEPVPIKTFRLNRGYKAADISERIKSHVPKDAPIKIDDAWLRRGSPDYVQPKK